MEFVLISISWQQQQYQRQCLLLSSLLSSLNFYWLNNVNCASINQPFCIEESNFRKFMLVFEYAIKMGTGMPSRCRAVPFEIGTANEC